MRFVLCKLGIVNYPLITRKFDTFKWFISFRIEFVNFQVLIRYQQVFVITCEKSSPIEIITIKGYCLAPFIFFIRITVFKNVDFLDVRDRSDQVGVISTNRQMSD